MRHRRPCRARSVCRTSSRAREGRNTKFELALVRAAGGLAALLCASRASAQQPPEAKPPLTEEARAANVPHPPAQVVPPRLVHFEQAPYPSQAEPQGHDATVDLQITIDKEGHVQKAEVREPVGYGFDEAAVAAATKFVFEPATRAGVPIASKILLHYKFEYKPEVTPVAPELPAALTRPGELRGKLHAGSPPAPLAGIRLRLLARGAEPILVVTAADGTWVVPNLNPGDYTVEVATSGYRRITQLETIEPGRVTAVAYHLEISEELPIEIVVRAAALQREVTHYEIPRTELLRMPGTMGDAIHAVEAMPSVARPRGLSGAILIRGSAPGDSQVHIEGTPVPYVFHLGSLSSVIPGEMLEQLEFYPSNFSVRYGRATGGIVEVRMRRTNPDGQFHGSAQVDLINARANVEGPIPKLRDWSFMGGVRASYLDRWLAPMLRGNPGSKDALPRYYDYQMYLERRLRGNGVYRIGVFGAYDTLAPIEKNPPDWRVPEENSFTHLQSQLRLPLSTAVELKASWSLGRNRSRLVEDDRSYDKTYTLGTLRSELSVRTGSIGIARLGTDVLYAPFTVKAQTDRPNMGGELASRVNDSPQLASYDIHGVYLRPAAYAEYEFAPSRRIDVTAGLRIDFAKDTGKVDAAPRLAARYVLVEKPLSTVLKGGIGLFYQPPDPSQTLPGLGTSGLVSSRAVHSMIGFEQSLTNHVTLSVEGFEKELDHLLTTREDGAGRETTENTGRGRVLGVDLLLRGRGGERFFGWIAYTLSRSTRTPASNEPTELSRYDQTHVLNLLGSYRLGRGWEIGGRFRYSTGSIYNACQGGLFDNSTGNYRCYGSQHQARLQPYHQLDLRVEKAWDLAPGRLSVYVDMINAYYHYSADKAVPKYDYSAIQPLSFSLPLVPSIGVRGEI